MPTKASTPATPLPASMAPSTLESTLLERLTEIENRLQDMATDQELLKAENNHLKDTIESLSTQGTDHAQDNAQVQEDTPPPLRLPSIAPSSASNTRNSEPKVASPKYIHGQRNKLTTFITQVTMVIALQATCLPNEVSKVLYTGSFL